MIIETIDENIADWNRATEASEDEKHCLTEENEKGLALIDAIKAVSSPPIIVE